MVGMTGLVPELGVVVALAEAGPEIVAVVAVGPEIAVVLEVGLEVAQTRWIEHWQQHVEQQVLLAAEEQPVVEEVHQS